MPATAAPDARTIGVRDVEGILVDEIILGVVGAILGALLVYILKKVDDVSTQMHTGFLDLTKSQARVETRLAAVETRLDQIDDKLDRHLAAPHPS